MTVLLQADQVADAAQILTSGGTVAFGTETVYGLGADASNRDAARKIFIAKCRPSGHPLIVHLASYEAFDDWVAPEVDARARALGSAFWPGPLTLVVRHNARVASEVVGGRTTIGLRVPDHDVALNLLAAFGGGVAAPSANRFGHVSPTTAQHVMDDLNGRIDAVLESGSCHVGVESTIIELTDGPLTLLRSGGLPVAEIEAFLDEKVMDGTAGKSRAAGMIQSHYAPLASVVITDDPQPQTGDALIAPRPYDHEPSMVISGDADTYARELYGALRLMDSLGVSRILVVPPTSGRLLAAVLDRLEKASFPGNENNAAS